MKKSLLLFSALIIFSTTSLIHSMDAPGVPQQGIPNKEDDQQPPVPPAQPNQQDNVPPAQNNQMGSAGNNPNNDRASVEQMYRAKIDHWQKRETHDGMMYNLNKEAQEFKTYTKQALAQQGVAYGFKILDRGLIHTSDALRKAMGLSTEEEKEITYAKSIHKQTEAANLAAITSSNEFQNASTKTKEDESKFFQSQTLYQDIATTKAACELMPGTFRNPACQKKLRELFARAGMPLSDDSEDK